MPELVVGRSRSIIGTSKEYNMDSYDDLLKREEARELAVWRRRKEDQERYKSAARQAHKVRMAGRLVHQLPVPTWEDMDCGSKRHLIADAEHVAKNPAISYAELNKFYQERLLAWGDTDNSDLGTPEESFWTIEETVLKKLKAILGSPAGSPAAPSPSDTEA
jgi:hypothetical protein